MKSSVKKAFAVLLSLAMLLSVMVPAVSALSLPSKSSGLTLEPIDPDSLNVKKLGEITDAEAILADDLSPRFSPGDILRVSIFLDSDSTLDAGYSAENISSNSSAISYRDTLKKQQAAMTAKIEDAIGSTLDVKWNLTLAVNAISANVKYADILKIATLDGVKSVEIENRYSAPSPVETDGTAEPNTANSSKYMVGASDAWAEGYTGAGSKIAIIDTGIDTTHQSFNASAFNYAVDQAGATSELMTSAQVTALRSQLNSKTSNYVSTKIPYGYNYCDNNTTINHLSDTEGEHGSHVAGIAAANRYIASGSSYVEAASSVYAVGMAPDAQLFVMKVFGSKGGAYDSDYFSAIEDAFVLGADSINLSLGSSEPGWTYDTTYQDILNTFVNEDSVVTISAGNNSSFGDNLGTDLYIDDVYTHTGGSPGTFVNSLGVASADNVGYTGTPLTFNNGNTTLDVYYTESESGASSMASIAGSYSYVYIDAVGESADYQAVNRAVSLSGKVVIVNRGDITFSEKGNNASSYNPKALIVANNQSGSVSMDLSDYTGSFPMVSIDLDSANSLKAMSSSGSTGSYTYYTGTVTVSDSISSGVSSSNAEMSSFSSWGVPGSLIMKPEITAPGGSIYSVWGTNKTSSGTSGGSDKYELMSGTSMAAPHMAGLTGVLAEYIRENNLTSRTNLTQRQLAQSLLMSTAVPMHIDSSSGEYYPVIRQGAGLANVSNAINATSYIIMGDDANMSASDGKVKAELGDDPAKTGLYSFSFTINNLEDVEKTYSVSTDLFTQDNYEYEGDTYMDVATTPLDAVQTVIWDNEGSGLNFDVDKNGYTNALDAQAIVNIVAGLDSSAYDLSAADVDGSGNITSRDAYTLLTLLEEESGITAGVVPAGGSRTVTVVLQLTASQMEELNSVYTSGAFIEGFTYVTCTSLTSDGARMDVQHSIPILGFFSSWTDPSMFDNTSYTDTLYGTEKDAYTGVTDTNYLTFSFNGSTSKFSGNPYKVEDEFPADRLAVNSSATLSSIRYSLLRPAGTTGFAAAKLDGDHNVTSVLGSSVTGSNVSGMWYYYNTDTWYNTSPKTYTPSAKISSYNVSEGDLIRLGFYAVPEYNGMLKSSDLTSASSGTLSADNFRTVLTENVLGDGAYVGYDFVIDNTAPEISASINDAKTEITFTASDNENIAYVAVMSLDGSVTYAEAVPGTSSYSATVSTAGMDGYVAVFAGDYAGNENAASVQVNDNVADEQTVYVLTSTLTAGNEYLIVSSNTAGSGYALGHSSTTVAADSVTVNAASGTITAPYISDSEVDSTSVWTAASGYTFRNGSYYLSVSGNGGSRTLSLSTSSTNWTWSSSNNRLYYPGNKNSYYLRFTNNAFSVSTSANSVYLYEKQTTEGNSDPNAISSLTVSPSTLELYKGSSAELSVTVLPITVSDKSVSWTSSNTGIATVDENGVVTGVAAGTATITAASNYDSSRTAACTVTVVSVSKDLRGIVWDEEGGVYFSSFNTSTLPAYTKLHSDPKGVELVSAFNYSSSALYTGTLDTSNAETVLYTVNTSTYNLSEVGTNYVYATDMAAGPSNSQYQSYVGLAYSFAYYLVAGPVSLVQDEDDGNYYTGMPYALLDCSETLDGAYLAGLAVRSRSSTSCSYYFIDENGIIWTSTLSYSNNSGFDFSTPTKVIETGISTSFLYQNLYYDGTYIYWSHFDDSETTIYIINPSSGAIYNAGTFGEGVWPVSGLYVSGSVAPAATDDETAAEDISADLYPVASRSELLTDEITARYAAEASKLAVNNTDDSDTANPVAGGLNSVSAETNRVISKVSGAEINEISYSSGSDVCTLTATVTDSAALNNGLYTVTYNADSLELVDAQSSAAYTAVNTSVPGTVTFAFADLNAVSAGDAIITLRFNVTGGSTGVTATAAEKNANTSLNQNAPVSTAPVYHSFGAPVYTWSDDNLSVTASAVCENNASHIITETVDAVFTVTSEADCETDGAGTYTAVFENSLFATQSKTIVISALGHDYTAVVTAPTCTAQGYTTYTCTRCDASYVDNYVDALGHDFGEWTVTTPATCTEDGTETRECSRCDETETRTIDALGHAYGEPSYVWSDDNSTVTATAVWKEDIRLSLKMKCSKLRARQLLSPRSTQTTRLLSGRGTLMKTQRQQA